MGKDAQNSFHGTWNNSVIHQNESYDYAFEEWNIMAIAENKKQTEILKALTLITLKLSLFIEL